MKKTPIGLAACAMVLAACGSSLPSTGTTTATTTRPTTTTINAAAVGGKVVAILNAGNAAIQQDKKISNNTQAFTAISNEFASQAQKIQDLTYPPNAVSDAKALAAILEKLSVDAQQASTASLATVSVIEANVANDEGTEAADSAALKHDLGVSTVAATTTTAAA
ncbi:MAG: hypothetical protein M0000_13815 [Actinomycetota bacterium]|nr:hypothetical protein [Actinomycetota bacterium]